jgi:hypothetical protein
MNAEGGEDPRAPLRKRRYEGPVTWMGPVNYRASNTDALTLREDRIQTGGESLIL